MQVNSVSSIPQLYIAISSVFTKHMQRISLQFLAACHMAQADYRIFLNLRSFANPDNSIASGACCDQSSCQQPCNIMLRFCFQDSGHSSDDLEGSCALAQFNRTNAGTTIADLPMGSAITGPYPVSNGTTHCYISVSCLNV